MPSQTSASSTVTRNMAGGTLPRSQRPTGMSSCIGMIAALEISRSVVDIARVSRRVRATTVVAVKAMIATA
jgi:hypothetical protein